MVFPSWQSVLYKYIIMTLSTCNRCSKPVKANSRVTKCDICYQWYQMKCASLSIGEYNNMIRKIKTWTCLNCQSEIFPLHSLEREELLTLSFNSNAECLCSKKISNHRLDTLPCFDVRHQSIKIQICVVST